MTTLIPPLPPSEEKVLWPQVVQTALHYLAAGGLMSAIGIFAYAGKIQPDLFINLCVAALSGLGVYHTTK